MVKIYKIKWYLRKLKVFIRHPLDKGVRHENFINRGNHIRRLKHHCENVKYDKRPHSVHYSLMYGDYTDGSYITYPRKKYRKRWD